MAENNDTCLVGMVGDVTRSVDFMAIHFAQPLTFFLFFSARYFTQVDSLSAINAAISWVRHGFFNASVKSESVHTEERTPRKVWGQPLAIESLGWVKNL